MEYDDTKDQVVCRVCGAKRRELNGHIWMHKLTKDEYISKYPHAPMISPTSANKKSEALKQDHARKPRKASNETRKRIGLASSKVHQRKKAELGDEYTEHLRVLAANARAAKGDDYKHSEETLAKMRGPRDHLRGRTLSEEHRENISKARTGIKVGPHSPQTIIKMQDTWAERKKDTETYDAYRRGLSARGKRPERIAIVRNSVARSIKEGNHNGKSKNTTLEKQFEKYIVARGLEFEPQYIFDTSVGAFTFDFYIPSLNLLVETDGEYWHKKQMVINRDRLKEKLARNSGYNLARISDKNWKPEIIFATTNEQIQVSEEFLSLRENRLLLKKKMSKFNSDEFSKLHVKKSKLKKTS